MEMQIGLFPRLEYHVGIFMGDFYSIRLSWQAAGYVSWLSAPCRRIWLTRGKSSSLFPSERASGTGKSSYCAVTGLLLGWKLLCPCPTPGAGSTGPDQLLSSVPAPPCQESEWCYLVNLNPDQTVRAQPVLVPRAAPAPGAWSYLRLRRVAVGS